MYLDAGMADEAKELVQKAMLAEPHASRVDECLADISQRTEGETTKESELLAKAISEKEFLVEMGKALQIALPIVDGPWNLPFGRMTMTRSGCTLAGSARITVDEGGLYGLIWATSQSEETKKTQNYALKGPINGSVCGFTLTVTAEPAPASFASILGGSLAPPQRRGFIVFAADGRSGTYVELKDNKMGERQKITRAV